ncbi:MAG: SAVED domain-containing protein [Alphaproteobacteria bacterium]
MRIIKQALDSSCSALKPSGLDIFYVGPAAFAVALGHRWNALPASRFYEFRAVDAKYVPTVCLT